MTPTTTPCPYCREQINAQATRCPHCAGEMRHCPRCKMKVAVTTRDKFVGLLRGGHQQQTRCARCEKVLAGPRM